MKKVSLDKLYSKYGNILIFLILVVIFTALSPVFLTMNNWLNILRQVSMTAIVSVGFTILLISDGLDLSVGSQIAVMNIVTALLFTKGGMPPVIAVIIGIAVTTLIGAFNGFVIVKTKVPAMMATIATMTALRGVAYILVGGYPIYEIPDSIKKIGQGLIAGVLPVPIIIMVVIIIIGTILLNRTYIGRYFYAAGSNAEATRLCGINVSKVRILAYAITGFLSGIAGLIMMGRVSSAQPSAGLEFEMDVLTAVVLGGVSVTGGKGSIPSAMLGVLVVGTLTNGMMLVGMNEYWQKLIKGTILLLVIVLDSLRMERAKKA